MEFLSFLHEKHQKVLDDLADGKLTDDIKLIIESVASELSQKYN